MEHLELPVLDMSRSISNRQETAETLVRALENEGFLSITNVQGLDYDKLFECCKWFFTRPDAVKRSLTTRTFAPENNNRFRGYVPVVPGEPSRKELFEFGIDHELPYTEHLGGSSSNSCEHSEAPGWYFEKSVWPAEDGSFPFKEFLTSQRDVLQATCLDILRLAALGVGIPEDSFVNLCAVQPMSTYRILHYPAWDTAPPTSAKLDNGKLITTPEHTDTGFMTLLTTFDYGGLEIMTPEGTWAEVTSHKNRLIMNIGDVFSRLMGGRFKATRHRVVDIGEDRYSVPYFMEPSFDADIGLNFMHQFTGKGPPHVPEKFGPWSFYQYKYVKKYFEYRDLPDIF